MTSHANDVKVILSIRGAGCVMKSTMPAYAANQVITAISEQDWPDGLRITVVDAPTPKPRP